MRAGEFEPVRGVEDLYVHDTGMFATDEYGAVYVYDAERPIVIDTGTGANREALFESIEAIGIDRDELAWILPTHAHLDHAGGAGYLAERYPNAEVRVPEEGVRHLVDPEALVAGTKSAVEGQWTYYAEPEPVPEDRIAGVADGDRIDLGDRELIAHDAPGHAPHHAVYHEPEAGVVFTADAAGIYVPEVDDVVPTTPPPQFDLEQCLEDLRLIERLDPDTVCFGHFGPRSYESTLIGEAKRAYVEWVEAVRQKRAELDDDNAVVEHFEAASRNVDYWTRERARANTGLNVRGVLAYLDHVDEIPAADVGEE
ncbi:Glyoxylase, beta-lactamase superfamily II [Halorubrum ezzemoulense]|uniref:Glyoxylase, beta-lactamase superfamily II n=1 Tax=Halorubrum ezzemoulense TaxID=337243 RepID=A0A238X6E7_HALEZ|nr:MULTISPECIES: MBL fold metallo-hydrolase [Halorubrum]TKX63155.1 MBL fold metallo-hydrolase [Halorubrum sp. GN12_10-3_MGM]SNR54113.1 Glyoxylase, beta-lactamase superfamily II [Halorubrum ezzemoulense]